MKRFLRPLQTVCAVLLAYGAAEILFHLADAQSTRRQSLAWLLVFFLVLLGYRRAAKVRERRAALAAAIAAAVLAVLTVLGREISAAHRIAGIIDSAQNMLLFVWRVLCMASVFYIPLVFFFFHGGRLCAVPRPAGAPARLSGPQRFAALWAVILLCWLPYFLAFYPGIMSIDSHRQLEQALGAMPLSDAHPVMHTALIALCVRIAALLGRPSACVALYSGLQMLSLSAALAYACATMFRWGTPRWAAWGTCAFFALAPMHPSLGMTMWKDVPHAAATLLLVIQLMDCAREPEAFFASAGSFKRLAALVATMFLFGTLRHNGFYVCLLALPFFLWAFRAHWKRALAVCLAAVALLGVYRGPVLRAVTQERGSVTEFLSIPVQFIARMAVYRAEELSEEDKDIIGEILPYAKLTELYNPTIADPVKHSIDEEAFGANPRRYASLFLRLAGRYPGVLLESFLSGNFGYWYPETYFLVTVYAMRDNSAGAQRRSIGIQDTQLHNWIEHRFGLTPGVAMLLSIGAMMWVVALAAALLAYKRRRDLLLPFVPLLFLWLSLLGSAVFAEYRYAYGVIVCAPICMGAALAAARKTGALQGDGVSWQ
ncbi:MAG: DUF6020 family protein [Clostridia bacterium]|nr:DUF6020 family protein [Clostridia bacterium]